METEFLWDVTECCFCRGHGSGCFYTLFQVLTASVREVLSLSFYSEPPEAKKWELTPFPPILQVPGTCVQRR